MPAENLDGTDLAVESLLALPEGGRPVQIYEGYSPAVPEEIRRLVKAMEGSGSASGKSAG